MLYCICPIHSPLYIFVNIVFVLMDRMTYWIARAVWLTGSHGPYGLLDLMDRMTYWIPWSVSLAGSHGPYGLLDLMVRMAYWIS